MDKEKVKASLITKIINIPDYNLITKATAFNVVTISFDHQNNQCCENRNLSRKL